MGIRYAYNTDQIATRIDQVTSGDDMKTAQRLECMRESFIREMTRVAIKYNAINLSQGFPDYDTPPEVVEAAKRALGKRHESIRDYVGKSRR